MLSFFIFKNKTYYEMKNSREKLEELMELQSHYLFAFASQIFVYVWKQKKKPEKNEDRQVSKPERFPVRNCHVFLTDNCSLLSTSESLLEKGSIPTCQKITQNTGNF